MHDKREFLKQLATLMLTFQNRFSKSVLAMSTPFSVVSVVMVQQTSYNTNAIAVAKLLELELMKM